MYITSKNTLCMTKLLMNSLFPSTYDILLRLPNRIFSSSLEPLLPLSTSIPNILIVVFIPLRVDYRGIPRPPFQ